MSLKCSYSYGTHIMEKCKCRKIGALVEIHLWQEVIQPTPVTLFQIPKVSWPHCVWSSRTEYSVSSTRHRRQQTMSRLCPGCDSVRPRIGQWVKWRPLIGQPQFRFERRPWVHKMFLNMWEESKQKLCTCTHESISNLSCVLGLTTWLHRPGVQSRGWHHAGLGGTRAHDGQTCGG